MIKLKKGYIAISTVLVISAVVFVLILTTTLVTISGAQGAMSGKTGGETVDITEGCTEEVLLSINKNNTVPTSLILPEGNCTVTLDSHIGNDWTFTTTGTVNVYTRKVQVQANRGSQVTVTNWKEIP